MLPAIAIFQIIMLIPLMNISPAMLCAQNEHPDIFEQCSLSEACSHNSYDIKVDISKSLTNWLVTFHLYCESDNSTLRLIEYLYFIGILAGSFFLAPLADYFGRKTMLLLSSIIISLAYLKLLFTEDIVSWTIVIVGSAICVSIYFISAISYISEITSYQSAGLHICFFILSFPISGMLTSLFMQYTQDWKTHSTIFAIIPLIIIAYFAYIAESPRFLASRQDFEEAKQSINKICTFNLNKIKKWIFETENAIYTRTYHEFEVNRQGKWYQIGYLFTNSSGRFYLAGFTILLLSTGFTFGGLGIMRIGIVKNILVDAIITRALELIVIVVLGIAFYKFGHIKPIFVLMFLTSFISILCTYCLLSKARTLLIFSYIGKLSSLCAFVGTAIFSVNCCPVRARAAGFGFTFGIGILGALLGFFVYENYAELHYLFALSVFIGIGGLRFTTEPGSYRTNDDIYEIVEDAKKNFSGYRSQIEDESVKHYLDTPKQAVENFSLKELMGEHENEEEKKSNGSKNSSSIAITPKKQAELAEIASIKKSTFSPTKIVIVKNEQT